jgi:hypothetical protein
MNWRRSRGAVHDEHTVRHPAARVALRLAQRQVVEAQLAEGVARSEAKLRIT